MNLIERIVEQMRTDEEDSGRKSEKLATLYRETGPVGKILIDELMMHLTGWRMETLMDPPWEKKSGKAVRP